MRRGEFLATMVLAPLAAMFKREEPARVRVLPIDSVVSVPTVQVVPFEGANATLTYTDWPDNTSFRTYHLDTWVGTHTDG